MSLGVEVPEGRGDEVVGDRETFDVGRLRVHEVSEEAGLEAFEVPALGLGGREEDSVEVGPDVFDDDLCVVHGPSIPYPDGTLHRPLHSLQDDLGEAGGSRRRLPHQEFSGPLLGHPGSAT